MPAHHVTPPARRRRLSGALFIATIIFVMLARCSSSPPAPVNAQGARISHLTIISRFVHGPMPLTLVTPAGAGAHRPLLVFLHGVIYDNDSQLTNQMFAALHALGPRAPDIAFPYGDQSYWRNRADGAWASYVLDEVIPKALTILNADPRRVAIGGISMGGLGAYTLAPPGTRPVLRHRWPLRRHRTTYDASGLTDAGAFVDASDFARNDVIAARANPKLYDHAKLWLDGGTDDPFHDGDQQLASALHIHMHVWPGSHDFTYWTKHWGDYLGFYARVLATCR